MQTFNSLVCVVASWSSLEEGDEGLYLPKSKKNWILSINNCLYCFDNNLPTGMIRDFVTEELHICIVLSLHLFVFVSLYVSLPNPSCCSTFLFSLSASQLRKFVSLRHTLFILKSKFGLCTHVHSSHLSQWIVLLNPRYIWGSTLKKQSMILFKMAKSASFHLFSFFQTNITILTTNICEIFYVHPVYGAGIPTHDLRNTNLLP